LGEEKPSTREVQVPYPAIEGNVVKSELLILS
jgi:hypothetical protein